MNVGNPTHQRNADFFFPTQELNGCSKDSEIENLLVVMVI